VVDETSLGKVNVLPSNPAESTCLSFWYSLGFAMIPNDGTSCAYLPE